MSSLTQHSWQEIVFDQIVKDSAFGPRFPGTAYADDGNIATLRTTDISADGHISYDTMPLAQLDEAAFANHFLKPGDLVITRSGRIGTTAIFEGHDKLVLPGAFLIRFRLSEEANPRFFCYWFNSALGQQRLLSVARGAAQQNINITNVKTLKVPLPPLQGQESIVSILSAYDDLIENNRRRIHLLEQAARLLYKEWFVHLRFPGHEHTQIIDGVPEGWEKKPLSEIADITMGQSPKSIYYNEEGNGLPFHQGVTNFGARFPSHETYCNVQSRIAEPGDILFSVRAPVGRINITPDKIVIGRGLSAIRSIRDQQNYLFYALKSHFFKEDMIGGGAIFAAITKKDLYGVELMQPTGRIAVMFTGHVLPIDLQIANLQQTIDRLVKARDLLLPKLMNGEVAV